MAIADKDSEQAEGTNQIATNELFAGDSNAESPFVITSREIGHPFPQGVGGERVDHYILKRVAAIRNASMSAGPTEATDTPEIPTPSRRQRRRRFRTR